MEKAVGRAMIMLIQIDMCGDCIKGTYRINNNLDQCYWKMQSVGVFWINELPHPRMYVANEADSGLLNNSLLMEHR